MARLLRYKAWDPDKSFVGVKTTMSGRCLKGFLMKREQTKIFDRKNQSEAQGSFWELCIFAIVFVIVFTALARTAHASSSSSVQRYAKTDPNLASSGSGLQAGTISPSTLVAQATEDRMISAPPIHMATQPSAIPSTALPDSNMAAGLNAPETNKRYGWTSKIIVDTSASLNSEEAKSYSGEYVFSTGVTDQKTDIAASLKAGYDREYSFEQKNGKDGDLVDPSLAVTKTWTEGKQFRSPVFDTIIVGLSTVIGASHESARRTFLGSAGPSIGVTKVIHKLHLGQKFGYQRKFYNYDIRDDGTVNAPDQGSSTTDISYDLTPSLALSAETVFYHAINYQGTGQTTESTSFSLDYTISKLIGASIGIATKRGTSSDDGTYNEVKFVDGTVAQGFFDLILSF